MKGQNEFQVFGIPGGGKTTYLSKKIHEASQKVDPDRILVSSFTRAASKELTGRDLPIPRENIGTLHSICYHMQGRPTIAESKIKDFNEMFPRYELSGSQVDIDESLSDQNHKTKCDEIFMNVQIYRAKMKPYEKWPTDHKEFWNKWQKFKFKNDFMDFTDLIERTYNEGLVPQGRDVGIFDEAQDFTPLQLSLIRHWSQESMSYMMICGDDDQCMYNFAGADPYVFLGDSVPDENKTILDYSHRCPEKVMERAKKWIEKIGGRKLKNPKPRQVNNKTVEGEVRSIDYTFKEGDRLSSYIEGLLDLYKNQSVMVLGTCSYMLRELIGSLKERGIPFANKYRRKQRDWNPLHVSKGVSTAQRFLAYVDPKGPDLDGYKIWNHWQLGAWLDRCKAEGILKRGGKRIIQDLSKRDYCTGQEIIDAMYSAFQEQAIDEAINLDPLWLYKNLLPRYKNSFEYPLKVYNKFGTPGIEEEPRLIVGTIHSVKGGEADNVILFPDISMLAQKHANESQDVREAIIRQFYVGMTRARERLFICEPQTSYHVVI